MDLRSLRYQTPCKFCYPDQPQMKAFKRFCPICNVDRVRACAHNGGVPVVEAYVFRKPTLFRDPGENTMRVRYVWPDRVRYHKTL